MHLYTHNQYLGFWQTWPENILIITFLLFLVLLQENSENICFRNRKLQSPFQQMQFVECSIKQVKCCKDWLIKTENPDVIRGSKD